MYQKFILNLTFIFIITHSTVIKAEVDQSHIETEYRKFKKTFQSILELSIQNKQGFLEQFSKLYSDLINQQKAFEKLEGETLTPQGNQMAFDIEALRPLQTLADNKANVDSCQEANRMQSLNIANPDSEANESPSPVSKIDDFINKAIKSICSK